MKVQQQHSAARPEDATYRPPQQWGGTANQMTGFQRLVQLPQNRRTNPADRRVTFDKGEVGWLNFYDKRI